MHLYFQFSHEEKQQQSSFQVVTHQNYFLDFKPMVQCTCATTCVVLIVPFIFSIIRFEFMYISSLT
jgi:hypothetical protein